MTFVVTIFVWIRKLWFCNLGNSSKINFTVEQIWFCYFIWMLKEESWDVSLCDSHATLTHAHSGTNPEAARRGVINWFNNVSAAKGCRFELNNSAQNFMCSSFIESPPKSLCCSRSLQVTCNPRHFVGLLNGWCHSVSFHPRGGQGDAAAEQLSSLRCHSPVQCCLNMIRQGSTVKRLKAKSREEVVVVMVVLIRQGEFSWIALEAPVI